MRADGESFAISRHACELASAPYFLEIVDEIHREGRHCGGLAVSDLREAIVDVPDFPKPGILFRDITPLLRTRFADTMQALDALLTAEEWSSIAALAGIESRGFILGAALALKRGKGFVPIRKQGKLPPPVVDVAYDLEYGSGVLEMQRGSGRLFLVDDVLATGGTMTASADLCLKAGYEVSALGALIDLHIVADYRWRDMALRAVIHY
jgi:adenine phosphoribosyltransferase